MWMGVILVFDYIVVGGGSSGCVIANRLSANGSRVLLIEAGPDFSPDAIPDDILDGNPTRAYYNPRYQWQSLNATIVQDVSRRAHYEQARVMGGGSTINAQVANRGGPADYDEWASIGATGWDWAGVLPYFRRLECDLDFDNEFHGNEGPLPISRVGKAEWSGFIRAVSTAYEDRDIPFRPDFNGEFGDGHSVVPLTNRNRRRVSAAMAYLPESVRARPNLKILSETTVVRLTSSGRQITGVETESKTGRPCYGASTVVLCAGAIHSPAVLMRSGIGPAEQLFNLGIPIVADINGVGKNLQEHPGVAVSAYLRPGDRMSANATGYIQMHARYSSGYEGCPSTDMAISALAKSAWHPIGNRLGTLAFWVNRSYSTGTVSLKNSSHAIEPEVNFNMLSDKRDAERLKEAFRFVAQLLEHKALVAVALDPFPSTWTGRAKRISKYSRLNLGLTSIIATLMDSSPWLRRSLIRCAITDGRSISDLIQSDELLDQFIRQNVFGNFHPTSTCRMGPALDPASVTDPSGRVHRVGGLRVADASVMPFCPRANTNIPTVMVAEKMSDAMLNER
ncbi:alanine-phosphoribitol ligase [Mesorhizobium loti]|uniref:GMC family oxidoreductase n=1 Tax=Mesorhizobium erdmanii TaxID=1777866 RepID=A0A6M7UQ32_9HYPH|nr:alanine-phosphoribitol ligase [Mesorhizobium loti]OBQ68123.1 alanine-phosphoribitol ligase [Mesorhizobium loti]QKC79265.1 GMC family oxidoreductase [Mesorhizobium erdmanii]